MSFELHNLAKIAIEEEAAGSFAVDLTSSGTYLDLPFVEGTAEMTLTEDILEPNTVQQRIDAYQLTIRGKRSAELKFETLLAARGTLSPSGTPSVDEDDTALVRLLKIAMGGIDGSNEGSTVSSASSSSVFTVSSATGFTAGGACARRNTSGLLEVREIEGVSTNTITLKVAFSETPSSSDVIYAATTVYMTEDPDTSLQAKVEGREQDDRWLLLGGQLTAVEFQTPIGDLPRFSMTWSFANWLHGDDTATPMTGSDLALATYANHDPVAFFDSEFIVQTVGTATLNNVCTPADGISITPSITYIPITCVSGVNTILRWKRNRAVPIATVEYTTYFQDEGDFDARDARTRKHVALSVGRGTGTGSVMITVPSAQVVNAQRVLAGDALAGVKVELRASLDTDATDQSTALRISALRIHFA